MATGIVSGAKASASGISVAPAIKLMDVTAEASFPKILVYPNAVADGDAQITFTIDGSDYTFQVPAIADGWQAGKRYEYTVTLAGTELEITNVSITQWTKVVQDGWTMSQPDVPGEPQVYLENGYPVVDLSRLPASQITSEKNRIKGTPSETAFLNGATTGSVDVPSYVADELSQFIRCNDFSSLKRIDTKTFIY